MGKYYCLVPQEQLNRDMILESMLTLDAYENINNAAAHEQALRLVIDHRRIVHKPKYYILKFNTKFPQTCKPYTKFTRDELEQILHDFGR